MQSWPPCPPQAGTVPGRSTEKSRVLQKVTQPSSSEKGIQTSQPLDGLSCRARVASQLQASEAGTRSLPSSHSVICQHPYQEVLLPASLWGQRWQYMTSPSSFTHPTPAARPHSSTPLLPACPAKPPAHQLHLGPQTFQDPMCSFCFLLQGKEKSEIKRGLGAGWYQCLWNAQSA